MENTFFKFEADFVDTLRCVPMVVRFKLDMVCIKLSLRAWSRFSVGTRTRLVTLPVDSRDDIAQYQAFLTSAIDGVGEPVVLIASGAEPAWMSTSTLPQVVANKLDELKVQLNGRLKWAQLSSLQRFALVKLTRGGHENENFMPALKEFGLIA